MAFVYKAERFSHKEKKEAAIGPGTYELRKSFSKGKGFAPFGSTCSRYPQLKEEEKKKAENFTSEDIDKINEMMRPNFSKLGQKKPMGVFKSGTRRFKKQKKMEVPGPGMYENISFTDDIQKKYEYKKQIEQAKREKMKHYNQLRSMKGKRINVPSIPSKGRAYGYTVGKDGGFQVNKPKGYVEPGEGVGPGQYNIPSMFDQKKVKGVAWSRSSSLSVHSRKKKKKEGSNLGPGYYTPISDFKPLYKYMQSAAFASETPRTFLTGEKKRSIASRRTNIDDDSDEEDSEYLTDATPGPGYYYDPHKVTSFKKQHKKHKFQIFGVASKRFKDESKSQTKAIGPGHYHEDRGMVKKTFNKNTKKAPFTIRSERFKKKNKLKSKFPGPGHYENEQTLKNKIDRKVALATDKPFCSTSFRFPNDEAKNENPGPGTYINRPEEEIEFVEKNAPSHYFKSRTKRQVFKDKAKLQIPKVGSYDLSYHDMYYPIQKFLQEPKEMRDEKMEKVGFNSGAERLMPNPKIIKEAPPDMEEDDTRGQHIKQIFNQLPTFNAYKDNFNPKKSKEKRSFGVKEKRFKNPKKDTPAPGQYYDGKLPDWNKPTFNLLFIEI